MATTAAFELGRAFPKTLFTFSGVAIEMRPHYVCIHEPDPTSSHPCLVCSWREEPLACALDSSSLSEACASCSLSAAFSFREPFSRIAFRLFESACTGRLGTHRCEARPGDARFTTRDRRAKRPSHAEECWSNRVNESPAPWVSLSPPPKLLPRPESHRTERATKAAKTLVCALLVKAGRAPQNPRHLPPPSAVRTC
jgi:hypothetical protein